MAIAIVIATAVVGGFLTLGSPAHQRRLNIDAGAVDDIRDLVHSLAERIGSAVVPEALRETDLLRRHDGGSDTAQIQYHRINAGTYELCTIFLEPSRDDDYRTAFKHAGGQTCYVFLRTRPRCTHKTLTHGIRMVS